MSFRNFSQKLMLEQIILCNGLKTRMTAWSLWLFHWQNTRHMVSQSGRSVIETHFEWVWSDGTTSLIYIIEPGLSRALDVVFNSDQSQHWKVYG